MKRGDLVINPTLVKSARVTFFDLFVNYIDGTNERHVFYNNFEATNALQELQRAMMTYRDK
jgi:hypothetical protein